MPPAEQAYHGTVHYSGQVQGVGFRYTTRSLARGFEVAGYVQNLPDGRVRVEVEGKEPDVNAFLAAIGERMSGCVHHAEHTGEWRAPQFHGFAIR